MVAIISCAYMPSQEHMTTYKHTIDEEGAQRDCRKHISTKISIILVFQRNVGMSKLIFKYKIIKFNVKTYSKKVV